MTRTEAIAQISTTIEQLNDEQLAGIAAFTQSLVGPSVYSTLPDSEKQAIDDAIARLDRGEGIPGPQVFADLRSRIAAARAKGTPGT
jgi:hypothetical protein